MARPLLIAAAVASLPGTTLANVELRQTLRTSFTTVPSANRAPVTTCRSRLDLRTASALDNYDSIPLNKDNQEQLTGGEIQPPVVPAVGGDVGVVPSTFNLVKNLLGAGVLSLPAGIAAFSSSKSGVAPALALVMSMGALSCYCFILIGRLCSMTKTLTFKAAVAESLGDGAGKALAVATILKTFTAALMYSIIIGDTTFSLAQTFGLAAAWPAVFAQRWTVLCAISAALLTPLCLLRSMSILSYGSVLGIAGTVYTAAFMGLRCFDGSYLPGGRFHAALAASAGPLPTFGGAPKPLTSIFVTVSMLSTAYIAHYNAPKFYSELKGTTVRKFSGVSLLGFGAAAALFAAMMAFGFLTFGTATAGNVLNNYAASDQLAAYARVAILASMVFGYPLVFVGFRDGLLDMVLSSSSGKGRSISSSSSTAPLPVSWRTKDATGVALLALVTGVACRVRNLGKVSSVGGALLGSSIIYVFPCLGFIGATSKALAAGDLELTPRLLAERRLTRAGVILGLLFASIGTAISLST